MAPTILLDHLASRGLLRHMPNPALAVTATNFQPLALHYAHFLPEFEAADYVLSMDVDEFVNVRVGDGTLAALIEAAGDFDVLSISELNHGCNGQNRYRRRASDRAVPLPTRPKPPAINAPNVG